jgi:hypothetical protein
MAAHPGMLARWSRPRSTSPERAHCRGTTAACIGGGCLPGGRRDRLRRPRCDDRRSAGVGRSFAIETRSDADRHNARPVPEDCSRAPRCSCSGCVPLSSGRDVRGWHSERCLAGTRGYPDAADPCAGGGYTTASGLQALELGFKALAVLVVPVGLANRAPAGSSLATLASRFFTIVLALAHNVLRRHYERALVAATPAVLARPV